jgi:hypothetical protein
VAAGFGFDDLRGKGRGIMPRSEIRYYTCWSPLCKKAWKKEGIEQPTQGRRELLQDGPEKWIGLHYISGLGAKDSRVWNNRPISENWKGYTRIASKAHELFTKKDSFCAKCILPTPNDIESKD